MTLETTRRGLEDLLLSAGTDAIPIRLIAQENGALPGLSSAERAWVGAQSWAAKQGTVLLLPNGQGGVGGVLLGTGGKDWATQSPLLLGVLPAALPPLKRFITAATSSTRRQTISALQSSKPLHASLPTPLAAASKSRKARGS